MPDDLSQAEQHLVVNACRGMAVDFRTGVDDGLHEAEQWGEDAVSAPR